MKKIRKNLNGSCYYFPSYLLCITLILLCFGCGGDEEETLEEVVTSEDFVGTWELIRINGKSPKADAQQDMGEGETVHTATEKIVFASDSSLFHEVYLLQSGAVEDIPGWKNVRLGIEMKATMKGSYVVSVSSVEFIYSGDTLSDVLNFKIDFSWNSGGNLDFEREANQIFDIEQFEDELGQSLKQQLTQDFGLELDTYTFDLKETILTLKNGDEKVYEKR